MPEEIMSEAGEKTKDVRGFLTYVGGGEAEIVQEGGGSDPNAPITVTLSKREQEFLKSLENKIYDAIRGFEKDGMKLINFNIMLD